ncbi:hypothetical protein AB4K20DRAFT_1891301 [Rhizopus microsporus]
MKKKITNSANTPSDLVSYWDTFKVTNPNAVYQQKLIKGGGQPISHRTLQRAEDVLQQPHCREF